MTIHDDANDRMTVQAAMAPLMGESRISAPLTSQLLAGAVLTVLERRADWLQVRGADGYEGWTHIGYLTPCTGNESSWRLSLGCVVQENNGVARALPLGARLAPDTRVLHGECVDAASQRERFASTAQAVAVSAAMRFSGASYLWGGVTPWGCDCSGFVQQLFALHGVSLPRDACQQALLGEQITTDATDAHRPGDLIYFSDRDDARVTHVGVALSDARMAHSALQRGGVAIEQLEADNEYAARLRAQCVTVQRLPFPDDAR